MAQKRSIIIYLFIAFFNLQPSTLAFAQKITFVKKELPAELKTINVLRVENSKTLWIASGNGLFKLENSNIQRFWDVRSRKKLYVNTLEIDQFGNKWLGTYSGELLKFRNGKISTSVDFSEYLDADNSIVTSIALNDNNRDTVSKILLTTSDGQIFYYDTLTLEKGKLDSPVKDMVYSINYGYDKTIWLCTSEGFYTKKAGNQWKQKQDLFLSYGIFKSHNKYWALGRDQSKKAVFMLYYDRDGTTGQRYVWKKFQLKNIPDKYIRLYEVGFTSDSYAWITSDSGLIRYNSLSGNVKVYNQKKNKDFKIKTTRHIAVQDKNTMWISSPGRSLFKLTIKY
ncbi:MAG: hypothetical protein ABFS35_11715 [Bacteroidota bacterium]